MPKPSSCSCDTKRSVKGGWRGSEETKEEEPESELLLPSEKPTNLEDLNNLEDILGSGSKFCCCGCYLYYLKKTEKYRQVRELYRILIIPNNFLRNFFSQFKVEVLKKVFRKKALLVHPDKNPHPNAKVAF